MPSASFLFSAVFRFRKVIKKIFSKLDETKTQLPILPTRTRSPKGRRGATRNPHHLVARPHLWLHRDMVWGPRAALTSVLRPIYCPRRKNPKIIDVFHERVSPCCHHQNLVSGDRSSIPAPCRDGELPSGPSPSSPPPSPSPLLSPMMRRE